VSINAPIWKVHSDKMLSLIKLYPSKNALWMPFNIIRSQKILNYIKYIKYKICIWLGHLFPAFPAFLIDRRQ